MNRRCDILGCGITRESLRTAVHPFDALADRQEILCRPGRLDAENLIQELRLLGESYRLGLVNG